MINDESLYLEATEEVEGDDRDPALWAKAMALSDGDEGKAKYIYINTRVEYLRKELEESEQETLLAVARVRRLRMTLQEIIHKIEKPEQPSNVSNESPQSYRRRPRTMSQALASKALNASHKSKNYFRNAINSLQAWIKQRRSR